MSRWQECVEAIKRVAQQTTTEEVRMTDTSPQESGEDAVYEFTIRWTEQPGVVHAHTGLHDSQEALSAYLTLLRDPARHTSVPLADREDVEVSGRLRAFPEQPADPEASSSTEKTWRVGSSAQKTWRVGSKYGIHVYECSTPVCTALTEDYARQIVADHNVDPDAVRARPVSGRPVPLSEITNALDALHTPGYRQQFLDLIEQVDAGGINYRL
jgi:hypothetical protein